MKFRSKRKPFLFGVYLSIFITLIISIFISKCIIAHMNDNIVHIVSDYIEVKNDYMFKNAFLQKNKLDVDVDNIINIVKNNSDEIIMVDFKVLDCEKMLLAIIDEMNKDAVNLTKNGYVLWIPIGYMSNSPLVYNLGPKIPVKIILGDTVLGDVLTEITEFGINSAKVDIYINIRIKIVILLPSNNYKKEMSYSTLIASRIINSKVPSFYGGKLIKESQTFNLPINDNL